MKKPTAKPARVRSPQAIALANAAGAAMPAPSGRFTPAIVTTLKRTRFNPIAGLTPEVLSHQLNAFAVGALSAFAMSADAIKRRDDVINPALLKREKATARRGWSVQIVEGLDPAQKAEAERHRAALQYCGDNLTVTAALDQNLTGGMRLLVRQMMECVGLKYAVHEIVWQPSLDPRTGEARLTAQLTYVPLWLFENTTGRLRFLTAHYATSGVDLAPGEWMVTVGDGILEPLAVAYMFKQMSLRDWVSFNDKFGMPGIHALTDAAQDTPEWQAVVDAVEQFSQDWSAVTNRSVSINLIEAKGGGGTLPFPSLVERMDRAIATICRGADLSTISAGAGSGQGASVQGEESDLLEQDDAAMITEALEQISDVVIEQLFGPGTTPLAYFKVTVPQKKNTDDTIKKLDAATRYGLPVSKAYVRQELSLPAPADDEELIAVPAPAPAFGAPSPFSALANAADKARDSAFRAAALARLSAAQRSALTPLLAKLEAVLAAPDEEFDAALRALEAELPSHYATLLADESLAQAWEEIYGTALLDGATTAANARQTADPQK